jgi:cobalt-zinc-cadmium resistance protein CzcA
MQTAVGGNGHPGAGWRSALRRPVRYSRSSQHARSDRQHPPGFAVGRACLARQLTKPTVVDGASEIYREGTQRYVAIKYSVRNRDLGSTVEEAISKVNKQVKLPTGYKIDWAGEYESQKRSSRRLMIVCPSRSCSSS